MNNQMMYNREQELTKHFKPMMRYVRRRCRAISMKGEAWYIGADVCHVLGYSKSDARQALGDVYVEDKMTRHLPTSRGMQVTELVNKLGVYHLILGSALPQAQEVQRWFMSEFLPRIDLLTGRTIQEPLFSIEDVAKSFGLEYDELVSKLQADGILDENLLPTPEYAHSGYFAVPAVMPNSKG